MEGGHTNGYTLVDPFATKTAWEVQHVLSKIIELSRSMERLLGLSGKQDWVKLLRWTES